MGTLVDFRCPRCNQIIQGTEEVKIRQRLPKKQCRCHYCNTPLKLAEPTDEGLGPETYYEEDFAVPRKT